MLPNPIFPKKLASGSHLRIIAPARGLQVIEPANKELAVACLESMGLRVSFSQHAADALDACQSTPLAHRLADLHAAFEDDSVDGIVCATGGYNSNSLLPHINYAWVRNNPKPLVGYSDITALSNGIYAKTGLVGYSGPNLSTFGMEKGGQYNKEGFKNCLFNPGAFTLKPSKTWTDDPWYANQAQRNFIPNPGPYLVQTGSAAKEVNVEGTLLGGNLGTFALLSGTAYMPNLEGSILCVEEDKLTAPRTLETFGRNLTNIMQQPGASSVQGIAIGRFQKASGVSPAAITDMVQSMPALANTPVIAGLDFGHTDMMATLPIGGSVRIHAEVGDISIEIGQH